MISPFELASLMAEQETLEERYRNAEGNIEDFLQYEEDTAQQYGANEHSPYPYEEGGDDMG